MHTTCFMPPLPTLLFSNLLVEQGEILGLLEGGKGVLKRFLRSKLGEFCCCWGWGMHHHR